MSHRVISGSAKGLRLKQVPGDSTRPIMDRAKEALFNIIGNGIIDTHVLDLFAGTGAVGIEALSRGAASALFLDTHPAAIHTIQDNLQTTHLVDTASVQQVNALDFLRRSRHALYSFVYVAPPQYEDLWQTALRLVDEQAPIMLEPDAIVVVQIDPKEKQQVQLKYLTTYDERTYGNTLLWFFEYVREDSA